MESNEAMANPKHLDILKQGVDRWNRWREDNPEIWPDLYRADLCGANLHSANLEIADLRLADLRESDLQWAVLVNANLTRAELNSANLSAANMTGVWLDDTDLSAATLCGANLAWANIIGANLEGADLREVTLTWAVLRALKLNRTRFFMADLGATIIGDTDLTHAEGLEACRHLGPSSIDSFTLARSNNIPERFLRGCGLSDLEIKSARLLYANLTRDQVTELGYEIIRLRNEHPQAISYYSCFISYSHSDKAFAHRLHDALQDAGIRCWLDEHQILPGDDIRDQIDRGINLWDKILLVCSESSLTSYWVNTEIDKALRKEKRLWKERGEKTLALIPLNLDDYLFEWEGSRASTLTDRHAEDLAGWEKEPAKLERALERIERALRSDPGGRPTAPAPKL